MEIVNLVIQSIKSMRPVHWVKNLALFAPLILTGSLTVRPYVIAEIWAFIAFSFATSATYIFNDIIDLPKDRLHPIKKNRPIASGKYPRDLALVLAIGLTISSLYLARFLGPLFFWAVGIYLILQTLYSLGLKRLAIIDIIIIAFGFVLRVYAGAFVINAHLSVWFLLTIVSVALFLASGKRRAELSIAPKGETRQSLTVYKKELLNSYVTMFASASWISWSLYTFFESPSIDQNIWLSLAEISKATTLSKLLMLTIPIVIFIIMRYQTLIFSDKTEAPEKILLKDGPLMGAIILWTAIVLLVLYGGVATL